MSEDIIIIVEAAAASEDMSIIAEAAVASEEIVIIEVVAVADRHYKRSPMSGSNYYKRKGRSSS